MIKEAIERIRKTAELLDDNDPDKVDMLNIEGDYNGLIRWAMIKRNEHLSNADCCKELANKYTTKQKAHQNKADNMKGIISWIMESANEEKFSCDVGSASFRVNPPKPYIIDEYIIPDEYVKTIYEIDKAKINSDIKEGLSIDGVAMGNGSKSLTIR